MAIETTAQILHDGQRNLTMQFTGRHDGIGGQETKVRKVDVSALAPPCDTVKIVKITYEVSGGILQMYWDDVAPVLFQELAGNSIIDYGRIGGMVNGADPASRSGDILFSTVGFDAGSSYSVTIQMKKKF